MPPAATTGKPLRVCIAGGSGFLGRSLAHHLVDLGHEVVVCSRGAVDGPWRQVRWDGRRLGAWCAALDGCDALVNLAGRSVDCIKTPDHRDEILRSRVESTRVLGRAIRSVDRPPRVWVQMSTAHIYGDPPPGTYVDETSHFGYGFAPDIGRAWEEEFHRVVPERTREVILRPGFVLGKDGGALKRLRRLARVGLGGTVGRGTQGMSWIHQRDMNRIVARAMMDDSMTGAYIASSPNPVSNRVFMRELRRATRMPIGLPAPAPLVRLGAPMIDADPELALHGRYCTPRRLLDQGFEFEYEEVGPALRDLCRS